MDKLHVRQHLRYMESPKAQNVYFCIYNNRSYLF